MFPFQIKGLFLTLLIQQLKTMRRYLWTSSTDSNDNHPETGKYAFFSKLRELVMLTLFASQSRNVELLKLCGSLFLIWSRTLICCFCCRDFKNSCYSNSYKSCYLKLLLRVQVFNIWIGVWVPPSGWWQIWREKLLDFRPKVLMEWTENQSYSSFPSSCFLFHKNVSHTDTDVF